MVKTNLYYKTVIKRKSVAKDYVIIIFLFFTSWPRLLMEVFLRKNFGERYFSLLTVVMLGIFLFFVPIAIDSVASFYNGGTTVTHIILKNITWYLYLAGLIYVSLQRQKEIKREKGTYDFAKFSAYDGDINSFFTDLKIGSKPLTRRQISIFVEPAFLLAIGIVLTLCLQKIGLLIVFCSLCYAAGYQGDYIRGDHFILDTIDEMICNEEMSDSFIEGRSPEETHGFEMKGNGPKSKDFRKQIIDSLKDDRPSTEAF